MALREVLKGCLRPAAHRWPGLHKYRRPCRLLTAGSRVLPDWAIIGAAKSGTTTLHDLLARHPRVVPATKEIGYFSRGLLHEYGERWYRSHFPTGSEMRRASGPGCRAQTGEATPDYLFMPAAPARMRRLLPGIRLIAILRNPVDRAYSHYHMSLRRGRETLPFGEALHASDREISRMQERLAADPEDDGFIPWPPTSPLVFRTYLQRGEYARQLEHWFKYYDRGRFLILTSEEFRDDRQGTLDRVFGFLGLDPFELPPAADLNVGRYGPMDAAVRRRLVEHFRPHNAELAGLLGRDPGWDR